MCWSPRATADGARLFWFENHFETLETPDLGQDISVSTTFRAWQTDLSGGHREEIATYAFPACRCETAVCSETCPEASLWLPDTGFDDYFILTHWVPGQLEPEYRASFLYEKTAGGWRDTKFPAAIEQVLDSGKERNGVVLIEAIPDSGCCGWVNASDDQTLLARHGNTTVLFDEFKRYQNQDYDVSFFTSAGKLSPQASMAALTLMATNAPGDEIRLSDEGKEDPAELSRIQKALAELPAVEVLEAGDPPKRIMLIPHARLAGWLNDREILVVENGLVVSYDVRTGGRRTSDIKVADESYVFLR